MTAVPQTILNGYRIMWLYAMFDLPVETKPQRRAAALFRRELLKDGFIMYQFSVYIRSCASLEAAAVHIKRVGLMVPDEGFVSVLMVTDKQFGRSVNFTGRKRKPPPQKEVQLELF